MRYQPHGKRLLDVTASLAGLVALSPLLAAVAAAVKLLDGGPVLFKQTRAGRGFKPFKMYKFRSMRVGGRGPQITSDGDPRITRLGRLLRKTKLDELPQLVNVLRGEMSLVGPRPTVPKYAEMFREEYEVILSLRPGITDYASVTYRDEESVLRAYDEPEAGYMDDILPAKLELYRRYIAEAGLATDLRIIGLTLLKVLGKGVRAGTPRLLVKPLTRRDRRLAMLAADLGVVLAAYALAFLLRFDFQLDSLRLHCLLITAPYAVLAYALSSYYFGVNRGLRYYAGFGDVLDTAKAAAAAAAAQSLAGETVPRSVLLIWPVLSLCGVAGLHSFVNAMSHALHVQLLGPGRRRTALVVGVGDLAELVYQNMRSHETVDYRIVAFFDDDRGRCGVRLHGVPVVAGAPALARLLRQRTPDEVVVAVGRERRGRALAFLGEAMQGLERRPDVLVMPTLDEMRRSPKRAEPRRVQPADLLSRRLIPLDAGLIGRSLAGKVVLVTGAGGTIGGELARQIARYKPKKLLLLDNHADALFYRETELRQSAEGVPLLAALGDVRDLGLLERLFHDERPQVVFHAAAHKHVYQLETNVHEGVSNNLLATYHLASVADKSGVETFILVSTDKAARPTSVMAATKRAAEIVVSNFARASKTRFASVRFGNVLGTAGSVMRIFQEQIEKGRPLTLTHPEAARFFMTVEEAGGLVLQAAALAKGGELFALKMGEQIRVLDVARNLVRLSGLDPDRDVEFRFVGLKPGENPGEEPAEQAAGRELPGHPAILVLPDDEPPLDSLAERILNLELVSYTAGKDVMVRALSELVPVYPAPRLQRDFRFHPTGDSIDPSAN